jgi:hypothetical protein
MNSFLNNMKSIINELIMIPSLLILLRPLYEKRLNEKLKAMESFIRKSVNYDFFEEKIRFSMDQLMAMCQDMWIAGQVIIGILI